MSDARMHSFGAAILFDRNEGDAPRTPAMNSALARPRSRLPADGDFLIERRR